MATTSTIVLTEEQRQRLAAALRVAIDQVPSTLGVVSVSPDAGRQMGVPEQFDAQFMPALLIT